MSIASSLLAGCSNDAPDGTTPSAMTTGGSSGAASTIFQRAGAAAQAAAPRAGTGTNTNTGTGTGTGTGTNAPPKPPTQPSAGTMSSAMPTPNAGADAQKPPIPEPPESTTDASTSMADCTPVTWDNPGMVGSVTLSEIPADAGVTKRPFESIDALEDYDYEWKEFLFTSTSPAYTTRLFVKKPRDPAKFSGTVFVEWYNASGGIDFAVMWANSMEYFMREGHAFVAVSAQAAGANALKSMIDAERYAMINHPGDTIANTVFSQAGAAIRLQTEALLGKCMPVRAMLAVGQSQSSLRLGNYSNIAQPTDKVYDGILLHSGAEPGTNNPAVPTFVVLTMSERNGALQDGPNMVEWMVAGATHNDKRVTSRGKEVADVIGIPVTECANPMNDFPSYRVYNAVLDGLNRWVREGKKPPAGMRFTEELGGQLAKDAYNNVLGGVRSPDIEVPIATHGFDNSPVAPTNVIGVLACGLGGQQVPFTPAQLMTLYPTHDDYVSKYTSAADKAVADGIWLKEDRDEAVKAAQAAPIPK
jgi:hypothetical protein